MKFQDVLKIHQKMKLKKVIKRFFNHLLQLALKLHPDKNKSPDAMEAFKHVNYFYILIIKYFIFDIIIIISKLARAYDCLTN